MEDIPVDHAPPQPDGFEQEVTLGEAEGVRYVFFPEKRRLLVEQDGKVTTYDTADHHITGVAQQDDTGKPLTFTTLKGPLELRELSQVP